MLGAESYGKLYLQTWKLVDQVHLCGKLYLQTWKLVIFYLFISAELTGRFAVAYEEIYVTGKIYEKKG